MRSAKTGADIVSSAASVDDLDLVDVLHDVVDEYDAGNCELSTLTYEVGAIIVDLDAHAEPGWLAELGRIWVQLRVLRAEQTQTAWALTETQSGRARALAAQLRQQVLAHDEQ